MILTILILLLLNGVFAMFEIAMVSARRPNLQNKANNGSKGARIAIKLLKEPDKMFSAIQIGITLIGIINGAIGGISFQDDITPIISKIPLLSKYASFISMVLVVSIITYFSLVIGELVPKSLALNNAEKIAISLSPYMNLLRKLMYPIVWILSISTKLFLKLFGISEKKESPITDEELLIMLKLGSESGVFNKEESQLINKVLLFGDKKASQIMTQRLEVETMDIKTKPSKILEITKSTIHSKILVIDKTIDNVIGVVFVRKILSQYIQKSKISLRDLVEQPVFIPEQMLAVRVIDLFRRSKNYFGVVIDEYGTMSGIITLHDLVENIMDELPSPEDIYDPEITQREDGSWLVDGYMSWKEFSKKIDFKNTDDEDLLGGINTIGGYAMVKLNRIPTTGDVFTSGDFKFEIVDMDKKRVDKILVCKVEKK